MGTASSILVAALVAGSVFALVAAGLSLVWGTLGVFNFAQGALLMLGAYAAYYLGGNAWGRPGLLIGVPVGLVVLGLGGVVLYFVVVRAFIGTLAGELSVIIATLAAGTFLENGAQQFFGAEYRKLPKVLSGNVIFAGSSVDWQQVLIIVVAPAILLGLAAFLKMTRTGFAVRAVSQNRQSALLVGIPVNRIYMFTFFVASLLAALAGILFGGQYFLTPNMGDDLMLQAFIVVVFGGLGSLTGTVMGAYIVGLITAISDFYVGLFWTPAILFAFLFVAVIVRPSGLVRA
jgi:branched-chain amino acid transport system permease protein